MKRTAGRWSTWQAIRNIPRYLGFVLGTALDLPLSYIKTGWRNLVRNRLVSLINILGLGLGLTAAFLITLFIGHELSYDRFHADADRIYRLVFEDFVGTPYILGDILQDRFPGIEEMTRIKDVASSNPMTLTVGGVHFEERGILMADPSFFRLFSFRFLHGDRGNALSLPRSIVLTESTAFRLFGRSDPLGEIVVCGADLPLQVSAVVEDPPGTSHFSFGAVLSTVLNPVINPGSDDQTSWTSLNYRMYVKLSPEMSSEKMRAAAAGIFSSSGKFSQDMIIQRMLDIHLHSHLRSEFQPNGDINTLRLYAGIGMLILVLVCINFMNLGTAQSMRRSLEVGMRRTLGAARRQLVFQLISEALLTAWAAALLAFGMVQLALPFFRRMTDRALEWGDIPLGIVLPVLAGLVFLTGIAAGIYPAFYISSIQPAAAFRGGTGKTGGHQGLRRISIGFQFLVSVVFVGCTAGIFSQMHFLKNSDSGLNKERIVCVRLPREVRQKAPLIKNELLSNPSILSATASNFLPSAGINIVTTDWEGRNDDVEVAFSVLSVDADFLQTFGVELVEGEPFRPDHRAGAAYLINETAARIIGPGAVGTELRIAMGVLEPAPVLGIVRDFHFRSFHEAIAPLAMVLDEPRMVEFAGRTYDYRPFRYISLKVREGEIDRALTHIQSVSRLFFPGYSGSWFFFDESFDRMYRAERRTADVITILTLIAVGLAGMGLLGSSLFQVQSRRKEIGVRRVLGAPVSRLLFLFFRSSLFLWGAALAAGVPLIVIIMNRWLTGFAYRVAVGPMIFVQTALFTGILFFFTGSLFVFRAASENPSQVLKNE